MGDGGKENEIETEETYCGRDRTRSDSGKTFGRRGAQPKEETSVSEGCPIFINKVLKFLKLSSRIRQRHKSVVMHLLFEPKADISLNDNYFGQRLLSFAA